MSSRHVPLVVDESLRVMSTPGARWVSLRFESDSDLSPCQMNQDQVVSASEVVAVLSVRPVRKRVEDNH